jgi:micrococcal nuclease
MYEYKAEVDRVVDGDTIDVNIWLGFDVVLPKQRIRLFGIDTPESRTRNKEEKIRGFMSKHHLQDLCPKGKFLRLESKERGKFGRILGILYSDPDNININQKMCDDSYAVPYYGGNKDELEGLHMKNKQRLIELGLLEG